MDDTADDSNVSDAIETTLAKSLEDTNVLKDFFVALVDNEMKTITTLLESGNVDVNLIFDEQFDFVVPPYKGWGPIHIITKRGSLLSLKLLVRLGANVILQNKDGDTALHIASRYGKNHSVEFLLSCNSCLINNVNNQGLSPLLRAVFKFELAFKGQYNKTIQTLLSAGCDTNICSSTKVTALHLAASRSDATLSKLLLNGGANVNAVCCQGSTPLLKALYAMRVNVQCIKVLLDAGADVNVKAVTGRSVLHLAVSKCDEACVESILLAGADPNAKDNYGNTPLWIAVQENNVRLVPFIVKYGGDVNYCSPLQNLSLLSLAITCKSVSMVERLIKLGASVDTETALCATPLSLAVDVQNIPIIKLLLYENCRLNVLGNSNHTLIPQTPLQIAFERGNLNVIMLLMKAGCRVEGPWLKSRNLPASLLNNHDVLNWIEDYCSTVQPLLHLCRVTVRITMGPGIKDKLEKLCTDAVIPRRLAEYLIMVDLLADDKNNNMTLNLDRGPQQAVVHNVWESTQKNTCCSSKRVVNMLIRKLYLDSATVVWNGNTMSGSEGILKYFETLPTSEHKLNSLNCQPLVEPLNTGEMAVAVTVFGNVKYANNKIKAFNQNFILTSQGNVWKIASDVFRFVEKP